MGDDFAGAGEGDAIGSDPLASILNRSKGRLIEKQQREQSAQRNQGSSQGNSTPSVSKDKQVNKRPAASTQSRPQREEETPEVRAARKAALKQARNERREVERATMAPSEGAKQNYNASKEAFTAPSKPTPSGRGQDKRSKERPSEGTVSKRVSAAADPVEVEERPDERNEIPSSHAPEFNTYSSAQRIVDQLNPNRNKVVKEGTGGAAASAAGGGGSTMTVARKRKAEEVEDVLEVDFVAPQLDYTSVDEAVSSWNLDAAIAEKLKKDQIVQFFPVQSAVVPVLLRMNARDCIRSRDICVAAPTGSGKTLAYAVPILQTLFRRKVVRLRALILLPSRELVTQVHKVFSGLTAGMDIKVGVATGQNLFQDEQAMLSPMHAAFSDRHQRHLLPADAEDEWPLGSSSVDILISTPGRLVDHLQFTKGFTLEHLKYLVLDEADRLLGNASDHWLRTLVQHIGTGSTHRDHSTGNLFQQHQVFRHSVQLLLFSATLTDNPRKLALLGIQSPLVVKMGRAAAVAEDGDDRNIQIERSGTVSTAFVLPDTLKEMVCTLDAARKPIVVYSMLESRKEESLRNKTTTLIFASSVETTHRLCRMLQLMNGQSEAAIAKGDHEYPLGGLVMEMSSHIGSDERTRILADAATGRVSVIVSSDNLARGIDLPNIHLVVNYDPPKHARTYVHRVGRTARANRDGSTVTFLKVGQMGEFNKMRGTIGGGSAEKEGIRKYKPSADAVDSLEPRFRAAILVLQQVVAQEDAGQLPLGAALPARYTIDA